MGYFEKIFNLVILALVLRIIAHIIERFTRKYHTINSLNRINYGLVSRKDLRYLSNSEFIWWCTKVLEDMGFSNIQIHSRNPKNNFHIAGSINNKSAYIKCIKMEWSGKDGNMEDDYEVVELKEIQKFVGTMEHDAIRIGYILTNGNFSSRALEFINSMPEEYFIKAVDGCELTRLHRRNQKQFLTPNLE